MLPSDLWVRTKFLVQSLAEAVHAAFVADDPDAYIGEFRQDNRVAIDGKFDLLRIAKRVLAFLRRRSRQA